MANLFRTRVILAQFTDSSENCDVKRCEADNGSLCSGHGDCDCETCICDDPWEGPTCSENMTNVCLIWRNCVRCQIYNMGPLSDADCTNCLEDAVFETNDIASILLDLPNARACIFKNEINDCFESYTVSKVPGEKTLVVAMKELKCLDPSPYDSTTYQYSRRGDSELEIETETVPMETSTKSSASADKNGANLVGFNISVLVLISVCCLFSFSVHS